jgi:hypothetical protein
MIFIKPGGGWVNKTQDAKLTATDGWGSDYFGSRADISGDHIIVGALGDNDNGDDSGSAYVYIKPGSGWADMTETEKLTASDGAEDDYFGFSVAVSGNTIMIGAYYDDDKGNSSGSVYQFVKPSSTTRAMFYSQAPYDGWVLETGENTNKGGLVNTSNLICNIGDDPKDKQFRTILHFNTSRIPDNAIITKSTLQYKQHSIIGADPYATHGKVWADIKKGFFSNNPGLVRSDFAAAPSMGSAGWFKLFPSGLAYPIYRATLKDTAFQYINLSGITQFRLRFAIDDDNDNTADYLKIFCGDMGVPFNRPVLRVWYFVP